MRAFGKAAALVTAASMLPFVLPICAAADYEDWDDDDWSYDSAGRCGRNAFWEFDPDTATLTISGTGKMNDYYVEDLGSSWKAWSYDIETVVIEEGITNIGAYSFEWYGNLTSVTIPEGVTEIGETAFGGCVSLTDVTLPDSLRSIGRDAFGACDSLTSIIIPDGVTSIGKWAFSGCENLTELVIPESVTSIGAGAFDDTGWVYEQIEHDPFVIVNNILVGADWSLETCVIPDGVTGIAGETFMLHNDMTSVVIPDSVTCIGEDAFYGCHNLTDITFPEHLEWVGMSAFAETQWLDDRLAEESLVIEGHVLIAADEEQCTGDIVIPEDVESIAGGAFMYCEEITGVTIPEHVSSIGEYAFAHCVSLASVNIPEGLTSIEEFTFEGCGALTTVTIPKSVTSIGWDAFWECYSLDTVELPENGILIEMDAFYDTPWLEAQIEEDGFAVVNQTVIGADYELCQSGHLTIPEGITGIGETAFMAWHDMTSVTLPKSLTNIQHYGFSECFYLTDVYYPGTEEEWNAVVIEQNNNELFDAEIHFESTGPDAVSICGDVNEDGEVDLVDVILLNKHLMIGAEISEQGEINGDVDENGTLDEVDSLNILKSIIKLIELPL